MKNDIAWGFAFSECNKNDIVQSKMKISENYKYFKHLNKTF